LPIRNPDFSQSSKLPLYKEYLLFFPKLQRNFGIKAKNEPKLKITAKIFGNRFHFTVLHKNM